MAEGRYSTSGQVFHQEVRKRVPRAQTATLDASMSRQDLDEAMGKLSGCRSVVVAAFASAGAYRETVGLAGELPYALEALIASARPLLLVALGSPYLLGSFPAAAASIATFSTVPPSEIAAVKALFGEIEISGRLPVSIPNLAERGSGLTVAATRAPR
jgi:beta-N-acetylhexosaminidase